MLKIAICDNEKYFIEEFGELISNYMKKTDYEYQLDSFSSGEKFLALGIEMLKYNIVFLDINMDEIDGITTAKKIREVSKKIYIVFVTAHIKYTMEGYKVNAIRYLLKDNRNLQNSLNECLNAIIEDMNYKVVKKTFKFYEGTRNVSLHKLLYVESKLRKLTFHVMEDHLTAYTMKGTLDAVEKELEGNDFVRIHQSYLVNAKYVKRVIRYKVILTNGNELPIPKAKFRDILEQLMMHRGDV